MRGRLKQRVQAERTVTQEYSPSIRRRINKNYLNLTLTNPKVILESERQSPKLGPSVSIQKISKAQHYFELSIQNNKKINKIVDMIQQIISKRMQIHQVQLLAVIKDEISKMQEDCKRVVDEYNTIIHQKNRDNQIYNLTNEIDYFRMQTLRLYATQNELIRKNNKLQIQLQDKQTIIQQLNKTLKKVIKKNIKKQFIQQRKSKVQNFINNIQDVSSNGFYKNYHIKSSIDKDVNNTHQFSLTKIQIKSPNSYRYGDSKSAMSTKIKLKKKICNQLSSTHSNPHHSEKSKLQSKSKSFWKFQPNCSEKY